MKTPILLFLSLSLFSRINALPSAEELLESIHDQPEETEKESMTEDLEKKMDGLERPQDRINAWLDTYTELTASGNRNTRYEKREEHQKQIPILGKYFPPRD